MNHQEGGQVRRLPGAPLLSEKEVSESAHPAAEAAAAGTGAGQNLRSGRLQPTGPVASMTVAAWVCPDGSSQLMLILSPG